MSSESFADLDLANAKEMNLEGTPALMVIPSKTNSNKSLFFGTAKGNNTANWVEHVGRVNSNHSISEELVLTDLQNNLLNKLVIKNNKLVSSSSPTTNSALSVTKKPWTSTEIPMINLLI